MILPQIINSLLENDMYKFSMGQCIYHQFSAYKTTWTFKCRNTDVLFTAEMVEEIKAQIRAYCDLRFTEEELNYLENVKWINHVHISEPGLKPIQERKLHQEVLKILDAEDYQGFVSIEMGKVEKIEEIDRCLQYVRGQM